MKNKILIVVIFLLVVFSGIILIVLNNVGRNYGNVIIKTYDRYMTLHNDGGTHFDTWYEIDLKKRKVVKYGSYFIGFKGYEYENKILYEKELTKSQFRKFNKIIRDIKLNKDTYSVDSLKTYMPYVFIQDDLEIEIYDKDVISNLEDILKKEE